MLSLIVLSLLFLAAGFLNRKFEEHEQELAREWYERGERLLAGGNAEAALDSLRTALVYSRNNPGYELRLGEALVAAQHYAEAKNYLVTLWERQPGSAALNLELARLAAHNGDVAEAIRYYEASLYGAWESNGEQQRRAVRRELIAYLSSHGRKDEAVAHTISFAANMPPDARLHVEAGDLFLKEESYDHAAEQFREALRLEPRNAQALAGAGQAAFASGDYASAEHYLERAVRSSSGVSPVPDSLTLARAVVALDPSAAGISVQEQVSRVKRAFTLAQERLEECDAHRGGAAQAQMSELSQRAKALETKLRKDPRMRDMDLFTGTEKFALDAEREAAAACGNGSVEDRALALLAARRPGGGP